MSDSPLLDQRFAAGITGANVTSHGNGDAAAPTPHGDWVIVEEPLQICLAGEPFIVTMRTPGHDHELAVGYLFSEGLIESAADLGSIRHCTTGPDSKNNVLDVLPGPGQVLDVDHAPRRRQLSTSACGLCGRQQVDDLLERIRPVPRTTSWTRTDIFEATRKLSAFQHNFEHTGGGHAAGVAATNGAFRCVREDVGRHNAVDKVVGRLLLDAALPASQWALVVSGRVSFEIVQKAAVAGFEMVIGMSAPSSLAIETAARLGMTLVGFARPHSFNTYSGAAWITA